jgi:hypothetical protein
VETGATQARTSGPGLKVSPRYVSREEIGYVLARQDKPRLRFTSECSGPVGEIRHPSWSPDGKDGGNITFAR